jgi:hypothetical protein
MDPITFETITHNPELIRTLMEQARRERAEAIHRLLVEPLRRLFRLHAAPTSLGRSRKVGGAAA